VGDEERLREEIREKLRELATVSEPLDVLAFVVGIAEQMEAELDPDAA
jgi:hypothetical protein